MKSKHDLFCIFTEKTVISLQQLEETSDTSTSTLEYKVTCSCGWVYRSERNTHTQEEASCAIVK